MISVTIGSVTLSRVRHVQPARTLARDAFLAAGAGVSSQSVEVRGFILGTPASLLAQKTALEDALAALGDTTLTVQYMGPIEGRVESVQWEAYTSGPIWVYTVRFGPKAKGNPFAGTVSVGALTLNNPVPSCTEQFKAPNEDDRMDVTHSRSFRLQGRYMDSPANIETFLATLRDALTTPSGGYFTLVTPMGSFSARARDFQVDRPEQIEAQRAVTYTVQLETKPDFTLETFGLPHEAVSVGGITWDVLSSFSHSIDRARKGATGSAHVIKSESMTWSVKKFFMTVAEADAFKPNIDALVRNLNTMVSPSGVVLECKAASYNVVSREGYDATGNRRYSVSASITFAKPTGARENPGGVAFGIEFYEITSDSRGITVDENGGLRSRTRNVSGRVAGAPDVSLLGSSVVEPDGVYYVTGVNTGKIDDDGYWEISVSGRTLDSDRECAAFIDEIFEGIHFNDVTNISKSRSFSKVENGDYYETSSVSETVTGYVWRADGDSILSLIQVARKGYGESAITNVSVGAKERWTIPVTKECAWRQSVSVSRTVDYRPTVIPQSDQTQPNPAEARFDTFQPDIKEETSIELRKQTDRHQSVPIPGGDIVLKKIGVNLAGARVRVTRTARNFRIFDSMAYPATPAPPAGVSSPVEEGNVQSEQGLTKTRELSWTAGEVS